MNETRDQARATAGGRAFEMQFRGVQVTAPCRLHFGLLAFGRTEGRQFGGVGVMVDRTAIRLCVSADRELTASGPAADRALRFARDWSRFTGLEAPPRCRIDIQESAEQHSGLGVGTQLGLSVAAALNRWHGLPQPTPAELALSVGRGSRSAIGTYGFAAGGLIIERGKLPHEAIAPLDCHLSLPTDWRFVLLQLRLEPGLSGTAEQHAFGRLPPVPLEVTEQLANELRHHLVPAAARGDFESFSRSLFRYGRSAGMCFAEVQGGPYNGPQLTELVDAIRSLGVTGVGQSSWGPTIFALLENEPQAVDFVRQVGKLPLTKNAQIHIAGVSNRGASVRGQRA